MSVQKIGKKTLKSEKKEPDNPKHSSSRIPLLDSSSDGVLRKTLEGHLAHNGKTGIRTPDTISGMHAFQACTLNHSDIFPKAYMKSTIYSKICQPTEPLSVKSSIFELGNRQRFREVEALY